MLLAFRDLAGRELNTPQHCAPQLSLESSDVLSEIPGAGGTREQWGVGNCGKACEYCVVSESDREEERL